MFYHSQAFALSTWKWFQRRSLFVKALLIVPIVCAVAFTLLVGNMGLAIMGTAYGISAATFGWISGAFAVIIAKAGVIIVRDRKKAP